MLKYNLAFYKRIKTTNILNILRLGQFNWSINVIITSSWRARSRQIFDYAAVSNFEINHPELVFKGWEGENHLSAARVINLWRVYYLAIEWEKKKKGKTGIRASMSEAGSRNKFSARNDAQTEKRLVCLNQFTSC